MMQATLGKPVRFAGVGLHTGVKSTATVSPAPPDRGIVFLLDSPDGAAPVPVAAVAENVIDTSRATVLGADGAGVSTTEHILSALLACGISNADIRVQGPEVPILDGSASPFADAFAGAGIVAQDRARAVLALDEPLVVSVADRMVALLPAPAFRVRFVADFPDPIGTQYFDSVVTAETYAADIAPARTFGYLHEIEALRSRGLARGGSLDNALVFGPDGPLQPLRWHNEVVRHKVLDLIGDLALLGAWPQCDVVAIKSGHELHALATRALRGPADAAAPSRQGGERQGG